MAGRADAKRGAGRPRLRFRTRVMVGELIAIGPGKIDLLAAIEKTGSLTAAAKSLAMSYRRAWLLLDEMNRALKSPAVESSQGGVAGGGSQLTALGHELLALYRGIEARAEAACHEDIERLLKLLAR